MRKKRSRIVVFLMLISLMLTGCADLASKAIDAYLESKVQGLTKSKISFSQEIKRMTLFGKEISFPCKIADLGEGFAYMESFAHTVPGYDWVVVPLTYEGKLIGTLTLSDYTEGMDLYQLYIEGINLGFDDVDTSLSPSERKEKREAEGKYLDKIEFSFAGVSFDSTQEEIIERLGEPSKKEESVWEYNYHDEGYFDIYFYNGKVIRMDVNTYS